tara:strand:- start:563 stop:997 length:435 start_codon:yes stop_codon:yes gene_type:complete
MNFNKFLYNNYFIILISLILFILFLSYNLYSVEPEEFLQNSEQELRARNISKNIRCLVCQNQSIDESNAPLAKDLRLLIRKEIIDGSSDKEIYQFLKDRYGDYVLLNPQFKMSTFFLWVLPFLLLIIIFVIIYLNNKKSKIDIK